MKGGERVKVLLVEDSPSDVLITQEVLRGWKIANELDVVHDGKEALLFLRREGRFEGVSRPDIIFLDLNLPLLGGQELLDIIKQDPQLREIPVIVLTSSAAQADVHAAYLSHANCYLVKPLDFDDFREALGKLESFWFELVKLPSETNPGEDTWR